MTRTIGIGVIGMGWMGQAHSRSYRQIYDRYYDTGIKPRLVICGDELEARAIRSHETRGFGEYTTDWRAVIDHPAVEVVNIASGNCLHLDMVRAPTAAGEHVSF